jgi:hypothetical protein
MLPWRASRLVANYGHQSERYGDPWYVRSSIDVKRPGITWHRLRDRTKSIFYNGIVWCPTTETGTWIARRNGRVYVTGNSDRILHYCSTLGEWKSFEFQRTKLISVQTKDKKIRQRTEAEIQKAYRDFRFKVEPGSSLPITKQHRGLMMAEFAKVGAMRWAKVMEEAGIENAEEEVQKAQALIQTGGFVPQGADGRKAEGPLSGGVSGGG